MPKFTFVQYEGSDDQIAEIVAKLISPTKSTAAAEILTPTSNGSRAWDRVATRFERTVSKTAAAGRSGQKQAILAWLKANGEIELKKLWKAAGVKVQHDYSGIGGSLTKNMRKAGGPEDWYDGHVDSSGEWTYKILPELVEPLKRAFGVN